jgi:hypothetical protein
LIAAIANTSELNSSSPKCSRAIALGRLGVHVHAERAAVDLANPQLDQVQQARRQRACSRRGIAAAACVRTR